MIDVNKYFNTIDYDKVGKIITYDPADAKKNDYSNIEANLACAKDKGHPGVALQLALENILDAQISACGAYPALQAKLRAIKENIEKIPKVRNVLIDGPGAFLAAHNTGGIKKTVQNTTKLINEAFDVLQNDDDMAKYATANNCEHFSEVVNMLKALKLYTCYSIGEFRLHENTPYCNVKEIFSVTEKQEQGEKTKKHMTYLDGLHTSVMNAKLKADCLATINGANSRIDKLLSNRNGGFSAIGENLLELVEIRKLLTNISASSEKTAVLQIESGLAEVYNSLDSRCDALKAFEEEMIKLRDSSPEIKLENLRQEKAQLAEKQLELQPTLSSQLGNCGVSMPDVINTTTLDKAKVELVMRKEQLQTLNANLNELTKLKAALENDGKPNSRINWKSMDSLSGTENGAAKYVSDLVGDSEYNLEHWEGVRVSEEGNASPGFPFMLGAAITGFSNMVRAGKRLFKEHVLGCKSPKEELIDKVGTKIEAICLKIDCLGDKEDFEQGMQKVVKMKEHCEKMEKVDKEIKETEAKVLVECRKELISAAQSFASIGSIIVNLTDEQFDVLRNMVTEEVSSFISGSGIVAALSAIDITAAQGENDNFDELLAKINGNMVLRQDSTAEAIKEATKQIKAMEAKLNEIKSRYENKNPNELQKELELMVRRKALLAAVNELMDKEKAFFDMSESKEKLPKKVLRQLNRTCCNKAIGLCIQSLNKDYGDRTKKKQDKKTSRRDFQLSKLRKMVAKISSSNTTEIPENLAADIRKLSANLDKMLAVSNKYVEARSKGKEDKQEALAEFAKQYKEVEAASKDYKGNFAEWVDEGVNKFLLNAQVDIEQFAGDTVYAVKDVVKDIKEEIKETASSWQKTVSEFREGMSHTIFSASRGNAEKITPLLAKEKGNVST